MHRDRSLSLTASAPFVDSNHQLRTLGIFCWMDSMYRPLLMAACLFVAGCTNNQLRRSTVGQAMTLNDIQHQQVMQNLASFAANEYALPRHVTLHDGTAQITDNGSIIGQVISGRFLNIGAQRTVVDQWSMLPVTNDVTLRLLKVAYRRALGSPEDLYSDDLANDLAQEIKKQTYQVDDLRTLVSNAELMAEARAGADAVKKAPDTVKTYTPRSVGLTGSGGEKRTVTLAGRPKDTPGITGKSAEAYRNRFQKIASANSLQIINPGEHINEENLSVVELTERLGEDGPEKIVDADGNPMSIYRPATPLVIELRRQVYETNKDLEDIRPGWLCRSTNKRDIPHDACYTAWAKDCGKLWYGFRQRTGTDLVLSCVHLSQEVRERRASRHGSRAEACNLRLS
jgi:hypothetical protein